MTNETIIDVMSFCDIDLLIKSVNMFLLKYVVEQVFMIWSLQQKIP